MSELKIDDLPGEILTQIFRCLDAGDLKVSTLVCKLWNNLIESGCRWSLELAYDDYGRWKNPCRAEEKMNFILTTNRKFGTISLFRGHLTEDTQIREVFHRHGFNIVQLRCCGSRIDSLVAFAELLNLTPNLTNAALNTKLLGSSDDDVRLDEVLPAMKKLRNLEISHGDQRIIKCFRKAKLTTLLIWEGKRSEHYGSMIEFLSTQEMLTSLNAVSTWILDEVGRLNVPIPFRLTKLAITHNYGEMPSDNLSRFVRSQAPNLREMEMGWRIPSSVYECVFASMTKLNTLSVMVSGLPQDDDFYERLQENSRIRTITLLDNELIESRFFVKFLKKLPNIRDLLLPHNRYVNQNIMKVFTHNLSKLESLSIDSIYKRLIGCVKFPNLKKLHIRNLFDNINWNEFTVIHNRLVELTIERTHNSFASDDIEQITTNADLQSIRLGIGFVADDRFFEIIRTKCANLKVLDLHRSCVSRGLRQNVEIKVLRLCDKIECSKTFW